MLPDEHHQRHGSDAPDDQAATRPGAPQPEEWHHGNGGELDDGSGQDAFDQIGLVLGQFAQIFDLARSQGLRKLMANMTTDQPGAQAAFRKLGFVPEALLADYVEDRNGLARDMVIMSYDVDGHSDQAAELLRV